MSTLTVCFMPRLHPAICRAQILGITAPAIYASLAFACTHLVVPPIVAHAPEQLVAKQWLQAYQYASTFVPPLIIVGTLSNGYLAYHTPELPEKAMYAAATALVVSIIPWTLFVFEPGINGSAKWKVQKLLQFEGYNMPTQKGRLPLPTIHTATPRARRWAETVSMRHIVQIWAESNRWRYAVTGCAAVMSAVATYQWMTGFRIWE